MNSDDLVKMLKLLDAVRSGNPAELMRHVPIEGNGQAAELMKLIPRLMQGPGNPVNNVRPGAGRDGEIYRLCITGARPATNLDKSRVEP